MSYNFTENFYATLQSSIDPIAPMEIKGTALTDDLYFSIKTPFFNARTGKPDYTITKFDDLETALDYLNRFRDMLTTVMGLDALPYRLEIAGLDADGNIDPDVSYVITKTEGAELPYRLQQYNNGEPCNTVTDFRNLTNAVDEARDMNARRVSPIVRVQVYDCGYREMFIDNMDIDENSIQPMYKTYMERKIGEDTYKETPYWNGEAYSPQAIDSAISDFDYCARTKRLVDVDSVNLEITDNRAMNLVANIVYSNGHKATISSNVIFDDMVLMGYLDDALAAKGSPEPTVAAMAQLYEEYKDDFHHNNIIFKRLVDALDIKLCQSVVREISEGGFRFSPLAWSKIMELNPSRATHNTNEEKQRNVKKDHITEER